MVLLANTSKFMKLRLKGKGVIRSMKRKRYLTKIKGGKRTVMRRWAPRT